MGGGGDGGGEEWERLKEEFKVRVFSKPTCTLL